MQFDKQTGFLLPDKNPLEDINETLKDIRELLKDSGVERKRQESRTIRVTKKSNTKIVDRKRDANGRFVKKENSEENQTQKKTPKEVADDQQKTKLFGKLLESLKGNDLNRESDVVDKLAETGGDMFYDSAMEMKNTLGGVASLVGKYSIIADKLKKKKEDKSDSKDENSRGKNSRLKRENKKRTRLDKIRNRLLKGDSGSGLFLPLIKKLGVLLLPLGLITAGISKFSTKIGELTSSLLGMGTKLLKGFNIFGKNKPDVDIDRNNRGTVPPVSPTTPKESKPKSFWQKTKDFLGKTVEKTKKVLKSGGAKAVSMGGVIITPTSASKDADLDFNNYKRNNKIDKSKYVDPKDIKPFKPKEYSDSFDSVKNLAKRKRERDDRNKSIKDSIVVKKESSDVKRKDSEVIERVKSRVKKNEDLSVKNNTELKNINNSVINQKFPAQIKQDNNDIISALKTMSKQVTKAIEDNKTVNRNVVSYFPDIKSAKESQI